MSDLKVTFLVPTRNKKDWVERAALSYLRQTFDGDLEIVFFDQSSTDGTLEILKSLQQRYDGPHKVRVLNCPDQGVGGTAAGMNNDINWVHQQIDGDVILWGNADDFAYPSRTEKTVKVFQEFNPSWVSCSQYFMSEGLNIQGQTHLPDSKNRWVQFDEAVMYQTGSSGALSYSRDLWDKYGPMRSIEQNDIVLPYMSFLERGMYFISEPLHAYVFHASATNQGIGGQMLACKTEEESLQKQEVNAFNLTSNWMSVMNRLHESQSDVMPSAMANINQMLWSNVQNWEKIRREMTLKRIPPVGLHA